MRNILFTAVLAAGLAGCVGGIDSPGGTMDPPGGSGGNTNDPPTGDPGTPGTPTTDAGKASKKLFDDNVYSILKGKCGGCHGQAAPQPNAPAFVATDAATGYSLAASSGALMGTGALSAASPILKLVSEGHKSQSYTTDEVSKITAWLAAETKARADGKGGEDPNSPAAITTRLENEWSACMSLANFTSANMVAWATVNTNDGNGNARCESCHNLGTYGFTANVVAADAFTLISTERQQMKQYFTVDSLTAPTKMIVNTTNLTAVSTAADPHIGHRRFNLTNNQGLTAMTALNNFYNLTMTAVGAGNCGAPKLQ